MILLPKQPSLKTGFDFESLVAQRDTLSLRDYQSKFLGYFLSQKRALDLSEAGTGKSPTAALWIYQQCLDKKVIWAMPKSLIVKNYEELLLWSNLTPNEVTIFDGTPAQKAKQIAHPDTRVFLMGFDALADKWEQIVEKHPDLYHLCVDEWHMGFSTHGEPNNRLKSGFEGARRTFNMYRFMARGGNFLAMTGTLIDGRLTSAYPALKVVNPNYYPTYKSFLIYHALVDEYGTPYMWKNHERLKNIVDAHSRRITFEEAYGAEKKEIVVDMCSMGEKQYRAYKEIEQRGITELEDGYLEAENEAVGIARCFAIMQTPELFGLPYHQTDSKEAKLIGYLEEHRRSGKPLIIFDKIVATHEKLALVCQKMGLTYAVINGSVNDRTDFDQKFRSGEIQIMICSPKVAGVGYNWGHVDTVIFGCFDWTDTMFIQNYRRAMRGIREKALLIILLIYRNGMDVKVARKLKSKSDDRLKIETGVPVDFIEKILAAA